MKGDSSVSVKIPIRNTPLRSCTKIVFPDTANSHPSGETTNEQKRTPARSAKLKQTLNYRELSDNDDDIQPLEKQGEPQIISSFFSQTEFMHKKGFETIVFA